MAPVAVAAAGADSSIPDFSVAPQYDTSHVYVPREDVDRFVGCFLAAFGGQSTKQVVATVTPTPSLTTSQLLQTPYGSVSLFGYETPIPYPFGAERTGWLVSDIAAIDTVREQKSISLNLKARREERTRMEKERLDRENSRRAAKNLPPYKTVEEIDKDKSELPDVVLTQAAEIMADMVTGVRAAPSGQQQKTARRG